MMDASEVAKPRGGAKFGEGAFSDAGHRRSVVDTAGVLSERFSTVA